MKNMGDGRRIARVEIEVLRLVAQYLIAHLREELPGIVTVSRVKMPADLRAAKVYVSILNYEGNYTEVLRLLQGRAPEIQKYINEHLRMRYCPKLTFFEDEVTQKVLKVEAIIRELKNESKSENAVLRLADDKANNTANDEPDDHSDSE